MKQMIFLGLAVAALSACGKKEEYKYNLTENQCSTGDQKSDSKDQMCAKLKDNATNNGCAYSLRKQKFEADGCGTWGS